jgi:hypothetical protein
LTVTDGAFTTSSVLQLTFTADPALPVIISPSAASLTPGVFFSYTINAPGSPDPSDPNARAPATAYRPVLGGYVSQRPVEPAPWRTQNNRVAPAEKQ